MDPNQSKIANPKKPNTPNPQNANFSNFQNPNIQNPQNPNFPNFQIPQMVDPNFSQNPHYPHFRNFNYPYPYPYPSTQNPNPQFYQYPNKPYPQNPQNPNVETKINVSTNEHKLIQVAKKASKSERDDVSKSEAYSSSFDPDSDDPEEEEEEEEQEEEEEEEDVLPKPEPVTQMPVVVRSKGMEKMKENIPKPGEEVLKGLQGFESAQMMKTRLLREQARALEFSARVKQRELDLQVLYKDTSSLSPQQLRVHKQMMDEISRRLESEN